jgi:hypothetical protein
MPLVLGFAGLLAAFLFLDAAISGASFTDILAGRSRELYRQGQASHDTSSGGSTGAASGTAAAPTRGPVLTGSAQAILHRLESLHIPIYHGAYSALTHGRTDQGVDYSGSGPVRAVADGVVKRVGLWPGWPGGGGLVYETALGPIFVMEDFIANVRVGQRVRAGQVIGHATGGSSGIETGLANATYDAPLTRYGGRPDGTATEGGQAFNALLGDG